MIAPAAGVLVGVALPGPGWSRVGLGSALMAVGVSVGGAKVGVAAGFLSAAWVNPAETVAAAWV